MKQNATPSFYTNSSTALDALGPHGTRHWNSLTPNSWEEGHRNLDGTGETGPPASVGQLKHTHAVLPLISCGGKNPYAQHLCLGGLLSTVHSRFKGEETLSMGKGGRGRWRWVRPLSATGSLPFWEGRAPGRQIALRRSSPPSSGAAPTG